MVKKRKLRSFLAATGVLTCSALVFDAIAGEGKKDAGKEKVEQIEVTGSRIKRTDFEPSAPVFVVTTEMIRSMGYTRVEDILNSLPQLEAAQTAYRSNGATGTASLNLRGLGAQRTLVLINGKRLAPGGVWAAVADVNQIPTNMIKRVEVMTGGGSTVYGADAVAGVVNFIMRDDIEGVEIGLTGGAFQHNNNDKVMRAKMDKVGYTYPKDSSGLDGAALGVNLVMGGSFASGKGHANAYGNYRKIKALRQAKRDYSSCALSTDASKCSGSGSAANPNFYFYPYVDGSPNYDDELYVMLDTGNKWVDASSNTYNYAPVNFFQRPDERHVLGATASYEYNDHLQLSTELNYMVDVSNAQIAESATFFADEYKINLASAVTNGYMTQKQADDLNTAFTAVDGSKISATDVAVYIGKRNVEGGPRYDRLTHNTFRMSFDVKGDIVHDWKYDVSLTSTKTNATSFYFNDLSLPRIKQAIGADSSKPCDKDCIPYYVFTYNGITPEAAAYPSIVGGGISFATQKVLNAYVTGDIPLTIPSASNPIVSVLGVEKRTETYENRNDEAYAKGMLAGFGSSTDVMGSYQVKEAFTEFKVPLVDNVLALRSLNLDLGARFSNYSTVGTKNTYKAAADWSIFEDLKARISYNRAIRAPNNVELYTQNFIGLWSGSDGCSGKKPKYTAEQCARTGVTKYGKVSASPAAQYNGYFGGNKNTQAETANTITAGVVMHLFENFNASVDYWNVKIEDIITTLSPQIILDQCAKTGLSVFCSKIHRAVGTESLWTGRAADGKYSNIESINTNLGTSMTRGVDLTANHHIDVLSGRISTALFGSYNLKKFNQPVPGLSTSDFECSGNVSVSCFPQPKWRHTLSVKYAQDSWSTMVRWRHFSKINYTDPTKVDTLLVNGIPAYNYIDLNGDVKLVNNLHIMLGINNIFDKEPPLVGATGNSANGNVFAGFYDTLGRYAFTNVTYNF